MLPVSKQRKTLCLSTWGEQQTWYVWRMPILLYLACFLGNGWWGLHKHIRELYHPLNYIFFYLAFFLLFYPLLSFITGLSKCTDAPYFTGSNCSSTPPLPVPHSAQIQKNCFHYYCVTKGHIRQYGVVSVSTDAFSGLTHPLAVCVSRFQPTPPRLFSFPSALQPLVLSFSVLRAWSPNTLPTPTSSPDGFRLNPPSLSTCLALTHFPNSNPHSRGGECVLRDSCCPLLTLLHSIFHREKGRWSWERRPRKTNQAFWPSIMWLGLMLVFTSAQSIMA